MDLPKSKPVICWRPSQAFHLTDQHRQTHNGLSSRLPLAQIPAVYRAIMEHNIPLVIGCCGQNQSGTAMSAIAAAQSGKEHLDHSGAARDVLAGR